MKKIILKIPINIKILEIIYPIIERILVLSLSFTKLITGNMKHIKTPKIDVNIFIKFLTKFLLQKMMLYYKLISICKWLEFQFLLVNNLF